MNHSDEFLQLITEFQGRLFGFVLSTLGDVDQANEVLQETNLVLWRKSDEFQQGSDFKAWSFRVAHFQVMAFRQRQIRDRLVFGDDVLEQITRDAAKQDEARQIYLEHCQMQAMLHQSSSLASFKSEQSGDRVAESSRASRRPIASWAALALAACMLFVLGVATASYFRKEAGVKSLTGPKVASIENISGIASFNDSTLVEGRELSAGMLRVESGSIDLRLENGTILLVEGPAELSIESGMQVSLKRGRLAARVSEDAHGFTVLGPDSAVVDLGTEFAMAVEDGDSWVEVYDGEVDVALLNDDGQAWKSRELTASGPVRMDASNGQILDEAPPMSLPRLAEVLPEGLAVPSEYVNPSFAQKRGVIGINHRAPDSTSQEKEKLYRLEILPAQHQTVFPGETFQFVGDLWPYGEEGVVRVFSMNQYRVGAWHHVVAVRRDRQLEIYLNGEKAQTAPAPPLKSNPLPTTITIGRSSGPEAEKRGHDRAYFKGLVDEIAVYPSVLSAEQVAEHYRLMQVKLSKN